MCGRCLQGHQKGCFVFAQPQGKGVLSHPRAYSPGPQGPAASSPREGVPKEGGLSIIHKKVCSGPSGGPGSSKGQSFVPESTSTKMELRPGVAATRWGPGQPMRQCLSHRENTDTRHQATLQQWWLRHFAPAGTASTGLCSHGILPQAHTLRPPHPRSPSPRRPRCLRGQHKKLLSSHLPP